MFDSLINERCFHCRIVKLYENHNHPNEDGHVSQPVVVSLGK
jgi:hypothetical protein